MRVNKPLALERWADRCKTVPLARFFALQTAVSAESCYQMCRLARERAWFRLAEGTVPVSRWRRLYQSTEILDPAFAAPLVVGSTYRKTAAAFRRELAAFLHQLRHPARDLAAQCRGLTREEIEAALQFWRDLEEAFFEEYRADLQGAVELPPDFGQVAATPESLFFYTVALPCWFEYGESIGSLHARACAGDFEALCALLRLDKFAQHLPEVRAQCATVLQSCDPCRADLLLEAQASPPTPRLSEREVTLRIARVLFDLLQAIDQGLKPLREAMQRGGVKRAHWPYARLSYSQILALFDAVAEDRQRSDAQFVAESPEAFKMALHRQRGFWKGVPFAA